MRVQAVRVGGEAEEVKAGTGQAAQESLRMDWAVECATAVVL